LWRICRTAAIRPWWHNFSYRKSLRWVLPSYTLSKVYRKTKTVSFSLFSPVNKHFQYTSKVLHFIKKPGFFNRPYKFKYLIFKFIFCCAAETHTPSGCTSFNARLHRMLPGFLDSLPTNGQPLLPTPWRLRPFLHKAHPRLLVLPYRLISRLIL
jgi:hypothetical protein